VEKNIFRHIVITFVLQQVDFLV